MPAPATFAELYCAKTGCPPQNFQRRIFWRTLHWQAWPLAPLLLLSDYFASDHGMINDCARATRLQEIYDATRDFPHHPSNSSWLRRHAKLRVSARRLCKLAEQFLPKSTVRESSRNVTRDRIMSGHAT